MNLEEEEAGPRRREMLSSTMVRRTPGDSARLSDTEQFKLRVQLNLDFFLFISSGSHIPINPCWTYILYVCICMLHLWAASGAESRSLTKRSRGAAAANGQRRAQGAQRNAAGWAQPDARRARGDRSCHQTTERDHYGTQSSSYRGSGAGGGGIYHPEFSSSLAISQLFTSHIAVKE